MTKQPERYILAVAIFVLAATAASLAYYFPSLDDIRQTSGAQKQDPAYLTPASVQAGLADWQALPSWSAPSSGHNLFISEPYLFYASLYPNGNYIQKDDGSARTAGGVLISWYRKYHLNFQDPNVDNQDPDGDGFSNKLEFINESSSKIEEIDGSHSTSPLDSTSHPSFLSRLRLSRYEPRPFMIEFHGYQVLNGEMVFQIVMRDLPSYQQPGFKKEGDDLGYENYKIGKFTKEMGKKKVGGVDIDVDLSTLELIKNDLGTKILLVYQQETTAPESTAYFTMLMPGENGKELSVARGKTFSTAYEPDVIYQVLDASENQAKIKNVKTNKEIVVPVVKPTDWDDVPNENSVLTGAAAPSNPGSTPAVSPKQ